MLILTRIVLLRVGVVWILIAYLVRVLFDGVLVVNLTVIGCQECGLE